MSPSSFPSDVDALIEGKLSSKRVREAGDEGASSASQTGHHSPLLGVTEDEDEDEDEEMRMERAVASYINEALSDPVEAAVVTTPTALTSRPRTESGYSNNDEGEGEDEDDGGDDLFGDEPMDNDQYEYEGADVTPSPSQQAEVPSHASSSASPSTSSPARSPTLGLTLPLGTGKPIRQPTAVSTTSLRSSTASPAGSQPSRTRRPPPSHLPKRLSGADFKRIRERREAEYKEAEEKLKRGEITPEEMPRPVRQRMTKRKKAKLQEEEEMQRPFLSRRLSTSADQTSTPSVTSPPTMSRGVSADTSSISNLDIPDDDVEVRELARSAWQGPATTTTTTTTMTTTTPSSPATVTSPISRPSPAISAPTPPTASQLPPPMFASQVASSSRLALPATPSGSKTLLSIVLKPGLERRWSLEDSSSRLATPQVSSPRRSDVAGLVGSGGAPTSPSPRLTPPANLTPSVRPLSPTDSIPSVAPKDSPSAYTGPLRRQLSLARERITSQVQSLKTEVDRLKLEADILGNATKIVDARILQLEKSRTERILAARQRTTTTTTASSSRQEREADTQLH